MVDWRRVTLNILVSRLHVDILGLYWITFAKIVATALNKTSDMLMYL